MPVYLSSKAFASSYPCLHSSRSGSQCDEPAVSCKRTTPSGARFLFLQIQHDLAVPHRSAAQAEAHAVELFTLYKHSLSLCKGLDPKEKAPGDDLVPIAVASLMAARNLDLAELASTQGDEDSRMAAERVVQRRMLQVGRPRALHPINCLKAKQAANL